MCPRTIMGGMATRFQAKEELKLEAIPSNLYVKRQFRIYEGYCGVFIFCIGCIFFKNKGSSFKD